jgi:PAS domain S-box-containing protein
MSEAQDSFSIGLSNSSRFDGGGFKFEDRFRVMVESVLDYSIFMLDPQGFVATWNLGAENLKGYLAEEIIGRHFSVFYPPEAIESGLPQHELAMATIHGRFRGEGWRIRQAGSKFWANVTITALWGPDHCLLGFAKVTQDLTVRRLADEALRRSNEKTNELAIALAEANSYLTNILDASTLVSIIATNPEGTITTFNRGAELLLGYNAEEVVGKKTPVFFHVADEIEERGAALSKLLKRPIHGFDVFSSSIGLSAFDHLEWTYVHKDTHHIIVDLSLSAIHARDGELIGFLGMVEDVTERQRVAKELACAHARLNSVLECTSDSVMIISREWVLLYGNGRTVESLPDFKVGGNYWSCFPAVIGTPVEKHLREAMEGRTEATWENYFAPYEQWYKVRVFPSSDGLSIFFSNITDEKKLQTQLEVEQVLREKRIEALSHMAGGLAHEISNPLAIIHARASNLKSLAAGKEQVSGHEVTRACENVIKTSDRAIRILRGLRGFAREAGKDPMELASVCEIADQCMELQATRFAVQKIEVRLALESGMPLVLCREVQIGQILTNLLNNAFDAIVQSESVERWISIGAEYSNEEMRIEVTDSGPGIEDRFKAHLMEPFFTTKELGLGMGVGLSLSRAIALDHGGSLTLVPDTAHTCFRLTLPIKGCVANPEEEQSLIGAL